MATNRHDYPNQLAQPVPQHERDSDAWHVERGRTIGASEIAQALGVSPYGGLLSLVQRKRDALAGMVHRYDSEAMADGRDAEAFVLRMAARRLGARMEDNGPLLMMDGEAICEVHKDGTMGPLSATPDGVLVNERGTVVRTVEAKLDRSRSDWNEVAANGFAHLEAGDLRLAYFWQVQAQLRLTGCTQGYLVVWTGFATHLIEIAADASAHAAIDAAGAAAMAWVHDDAGRLPAASDADDLAAIARAVRPASDATVEVTEFVAAAMDAYVALGKQIDDLESQRDVAKRTILEAHNLGTKLVAPSGARSAYLAGSVRNSIDTKRLQDEQPELAARYTKTTTTAASCRVTFAKRKE